MSKWVEHCEEKDKLTSFVRKVNEDTHCKDVTEFVEFLFNCVGVNKTYDDYRNMTPEEKKSFKRDIKIKTILNDYS